MKDAVSGGEMAQCVYLMIEIAFEWLHVKLHIRYVIGWEGMLALTALDVILFYPLDFWMVRFCPSAVRETQNHRYSLDDDGDDSVPTMNVWTSRNRNLAPTGIFSSMHSRRRN